MTFDELWEQEEQQGLTQRLRQEYPAWQRRRRVRRTALVSVTVLAVGVFFTIHLTLSQPQDYDYICCNRTSLPECHWADVAASILTIES